MSKGRLCKSAACCFAPRSFQLQQDHPSIFPTAADGWGPKGEVRAQNSDPHLTLALKFKVKTISTAAEH